MLCVRRCFRWQSLLAIWLLDGLLSPSMVLAQHPLYYDTRFVKNFTRQMYLRHEVECFVSFVADRRPQRPLVDELFTRSLHYSLVTDLNLPTVTWGQKGNVSLSPVLSKKTLIFATIRNLRSETEPMLEVVHKSLYRRHDLRIVFILKSLHNVKPNVEELKKFFAWCWRRNLINVALTFQQITFTNSSYNVHNELYSYNPFPRVRLLNLTSLGASYKWKLVDVSNVHGYEFNVPVFQDLLKAFLLPDGQLCGGFGMLLGAFINHTNGRLRIEPTPEINRHNYHNTTLLAPYRGEIDIGAHFYTHMNLNSELVEGGSTLSHTQTCLMVPRQSELPLHKFSHRGGQRNIVLVTITTLIVVVGWHLVTHNGYTGLYFVFIVLFQQPLEDVVFRRLSNAYKMIHVTCLLNAFLLWSARIAYLSALFSTNQWDKQINNLDDFMASPLRIMVTETQVEMFFTRGLLPAALQQRLLVVNASTLQEHLDNLNTSYAYCSSANHWQLVRLQQSRLRHPLFIRVRPNLCTPTQLRYIPLQLNSPFREHLYRFYVASQRNGFYRKWEKMSFMMAVETGLVKMCNNTETPFVTLKIEDFKVIIRSYSFSILICLLCLLCEIIWKHRQHLIGNGG